ncbi:hypothetical protein MTR_4g111740 [Medicago truncatula]|uniref:Uncharacterized protein n=1 Tax=Medicago truncatula TaxID=3880 RepID=G7JS14_MEDTR|nr:hypothetical protein MTR_4g111740 [Medicago truncatula]
MAVTCSFFILNRHSLIPSHEFVKNQNELQLIKFNIKEKIVDKEDVELRLAKVLGVELVERMKEKELVVEEWVVAVYDCYNIDGG